MEHAPEADDLPLDESIDDADLEPVVGGIVPSIIDGESNITTTTVLL